ncbi:zinc finger and SCAN domain-containing protein 2-like [Schistocerca cancellata]|uniref:zinc finger and SCAN domain-containing protein 2-like n=1 Tax=Schistocerca cancellata TaxID=274614 RepID=UPI002119AEAE|nr:zinc finger and SCAN domain-containing protein 2-like [Schistocerca cancellata]
MGTVPNLDKLCRICTNENTEGVPIFGEDGKKLYLEEKIKKYLTITVTSEDDLPKMVCGNCCRKLDSIHRFVSMAIKMQDKLKALIEARGKEETKKEHSILHSILSKGSETDSEVTEVEVRVDPMLFLCALEDGSHDSDESFEASSDINQCNITNEEQDTSDKDDSNVTCSVDTAHDSDTDLAETKEADECDTSECDNKSETDMPTNNTVQARVVPAHVITHASIPPILEKETKPYQCTLCSRGFNNDIGLQNHLWSHLPRDRRVLGTSDGNHMQRHLPVYSSRGVLHTNTAVGTAVRFVCPVCGKKISTKGNLKVHLETHRPKGKYGCDICGRVFKTQSNLYRHKEYHGGVQFPCGVCGRVYPTNSTLRAHSITHSDLRPHACPLCDKTFKRNQDLKFHINQHTGARPYQCPYCPKAFASSGNCFSHRKRMHPMEVERDRERAAQLMR